MGSPRPKKYLDINRLRTRLGLMCVILFFLLVLVVLYVFLYWLPSLGT